MSKKVYIAGAMIPTGGAYMAYHVGRILARHFGYAPVNVHIYDVAERIFEYDTPMQTVSVPELQRAITSEDILVVNPAFSSFLFGLILPGKKIMYVQDFRTFLLLDCHCDVYVSVSELVSRYVQSLYDIRTPILPAFIDTQGVVATPWESRPKNSALVYVKNPSREHQILLQFLRNKLPQIDLSNVIEGRGISHPEFLQKLGEVRYFVNLSLAEGFGLVPLEAMAMGAMVTGVDGLAGVDYMRQGENAYVGSIKDLRPLPAILQRAFEDAALAKKCVEGGFKTAAQYSYAQFEKTWLEQLKKIAL